MKKELLEGREHQVLSTFFRANILLGLFYLEDEGDMILRKVG
jgi:hypothetical protein